MSSNTIERLNNEAVDLLDRDKVKIALDSLGRALRLLQTTVSHQPTNETAPRAASAARMGYENGDGMDTSVQTLDDTSSEANKDERSSDERNAAAHDSSQHQRGQPQPRQEEQTKRIVAPTKDQLCRVEQGDLHSAYFYGKGARLDTKKLIQHLRNPLMVMIWGENDERREEEPCMVVPSATILFNLGLAHHKSAIRNGFHDTPRGSKHVHKSLQFYRMTLELIQHAVSADFYDHFEDQRILVGTLNNIGQIHFSSENHEAARRYFQLCLSLIVSPSIGEEGRNEDRTTRIPGYLFDSQDLSGLVFNATTLASALSHPKDHAKAA